MIPINYPEKKKYADYMQKKRIEIKFSQFVFCITKYRSSVSMLQISAKKLNIIWLVEIKLYVIFSVIPKCNNGLITHCYVWV